MINPSARSVSRADRARDAIAAAILLLGAALWGYGFLGLRTLEREPIVVRTGGPSAVEQALWFWNFTRAGKVILVVGVAALLWSYWQHHRQSTR
ncbi:MAG TPA: hypothetical protein VJ672_17905 [Gemmatimonadaceae bacterium]|nr:hypothetical protein [Gemmatimonadaceae bacterium]